MEHFWGNHCSSDDEFVTWQDMVRLANTRGVRYVAKSPLSVAGLSMPIGSERVILIKDDDAPTRQRFTLAHEVAHSFLEEATKAEVWRRTPVDAGQSAVDALETFCDQLASRILMPKSRVSKDFKGESPVPSLLLNLAKKYRVSRQAFCIRAVSIIGGSYHIAEWRKEIDQNGGGRVRRSWQAAARGMTRIMPETTTMHSPVGDLFERCLAGGTASYSGEIVLEAKRETVEMRACLVQQGPGATMLTVTRRAKAKRETSSV